MHKNIIDESITKRIQEQTCHRSKLAPRDNTLKNRTCIYFAL